MGRETVFWYRVPDVDEDIYYKCPLAACWDFDEDADDMAERAAEDLWDNHDGWESSWPLVISIHKTEGGPEMARFSVEMEARPYFYANDLPASS